MCSAGLIRMLLPRDTGAPNPVEFMLKLSAIGTADNVDGTGRHSSAV